MKPAPFRISAQHGRGSGGDAGASGARGRARAGGRPEPGADHGVPPGAAGSISSTSTASPGSGASRRGRPARHRRLRAPCGLPPPGRRRAAGALLAAVVRHIAHYPIRTRGTFCGSLAHADPASEWCLVAATLDAEMVARSSARVPRHRGGGLFPGHHDDGARTGRTAGRGAPAAAAGGDPLRVSTSSAGAPATSPWPWRS